MTQQWKHREDRLEAYIDNLLAGDDRARFEQELSQDTNLAMVVTRGREMNAKMRAYFEPPPVPAWATARRLAEHRGSQNGKADAAVLHQIKPAAKVPAVASSQRRRWLRPFAAAAAFVLIGLGAWLVWQNIGIGRSSSGYDARQWHSLEDAYALLEEPDWVCESDEIFAATFRGRFDQPLLFKDPPGEPTMAGLAYCHSISRDTVCMVGSADVNSRIVVFVDRLEKDTKPVLPADSGLHLYRRELGTLVLYEVSPKDHPILLDWFYIPQSG